MKKIPTAEETLARFIETFPTTEEAIRLNGMTDEAIKRNVKQAMIEHTKLHVQAALEAVSELEQFKGTPWRKYSIINAYPSSNIK